jgi:hypothetical protein
MTEQMGGGSADVGAALDAAGISYGTCRRTCLLCRSIPRLYYGSLGPSPSYPGSASGRRCHYWLNIKDHTDAKPKESE